jgi:hypothetical protein
MKKLKKWNWLAFWVVLLACCMGSVANINIHNIRDWAILSFGFGLPFGLLFAWISGDE